MFYTPQAKTILTRGQTEKRHKRERGRPRSGHLGGGTFCVSVTSHGHGFTRSLKDMNRNKTSVLLGHALHGNQNTREVNVHGSQYDQNDLKSPHKKELSPSNYTKKKKSYFFF